MMCFRSWCTMCCGDVPLQSLIPPGITKGAFVAVHRTTVTAAAALRSAIALAFPFCFPLILGLCWYRYCSQRCAVQTARCTQQRSTSLRGPVTRGSTKMLQPLGRPSRIMAHPPTTFTASCRMACNPSVLPSARGTGPCSDQGCTSQKHCKWRQHLQQVNVFPALLLLDSCNVSLRFLDSSVALQSLARCGRGRTGCQPARAYLQAHCNQFALTSRVCSCATL